MAVDKLNIMGVSWTVEWVDALGDNYGESDHEDASIEIVEGLRPELDKEILLHEVMHAVLRQQGRHYCKTEETYVTALAAGLAVVLRENPKLVKYLTKAD